jgi:putative membrane protein
LFFWRLTTTAAWGYTPLQDQQLGGVIMWVPGMVLFLWASIRSLRRLGMALDEVKPT